MDKFDELLNKIGNTPLVETKIERVYAKLESYNPAGSIKDRAAFFMLRRAKDKIGKGIVEATSGNTGIGLAYVGSQIGVKTVIVMPDNMSLERRQMIASHGAQLVLTPAAEGMDGAVRKAKELEADGIVQRKLYPIVPPKTEYSLTQRGKTLIPSIIELNKWGINYLKEENIPCAYKTEGDI